MARTDSKKANGDPLEGSSVPPSYPDPVQENVNTRPNPWSTRKKTESQ